MTTKMTDERIYELVREMGEKYDLCSIIFARDQIAVEFARAVEAEVEARTNSHVVPDVVLKALDIALDLSMAEAENIHRFYEGYKKHKHDAADRDVATVKLAIDSVSGDGKTKEKP